uniref:ras GTPase-activating protein 3-like isoform X2 n=1 Tax=Myxine glutinosa TaxID=7769 RepID=UPI00358FE584
MEEDEVRVLQSVRIKLGEAKNLQPHPSTHRLRDCFCTVNLDQEEVFRTQVVEKCLCPFFGEDYYCEIPRSFRFLSFYLYDRVLRRDTVIGKVAIDREKLSMYNGKDTWFAVQQVDDNSEVQGKVHLEITVKEVISDGGNVIHQLLVRVLECQGLPIVNDRCDPYAVVTLTGPTRNEQKKTKVKKETTNPFFNEVFYFEVSRPGSYARKDHFDVEEEDLEKLEIKVELFNACNLKLGEMPFLGEVRIALKEILPNPMYNAWYFLQPRNGRKQGKGSLRLNITYTEDHVLNAQYYDTLRKLLLDSAEAKHVSSCAAVVLGEVCREKQEAAMPLVRLLLCHSAAVPFLTALADSEIAHTSDANTIFRGNSLASKCIDEVMKQTGIPYLQLTLKPVVDMKNLKQYVTQVFRAVMDSAKHCPTVMSDIFFSLRQSAIKHFPDDPDVKYTAVSSFIFLRFFAPAILSPNLFHLRDHCPDQQTSRTLKLISKTIQAFGSLLKSRSCNMKEPFMAEFYETFDDDCRQDVKNFLDLISLSGKRNTIIRDQEIVLKEGRVTKRAQGRRKLSLRNFKERWLRLTNLHLSYHRTKDSPPLCIIPLEDILAVEGVEEESFKKKNMFQVIQPQRTLYVQASNCVEAKSWMDVLARVSQSNTRLEFYHPAAYISGTWLCCKALIESANGCKHCTGRPATNIELDIDSDRETQRIYSLFINNVDLLEKMQEACGSRAVYDGPTTEQEYAAFNIEEPYRMFLSLRDVTVTVRELEEHHERIRSTRFQKTKYGSVEYPIGDKSHHNTVRPSLSL